MVEGVEEEGLALARLYIPGLSRYYIGKLVREGYNDKRCLEELTEEELGRVLPERLVKRIKSRIKEEKENQEAKKQKVEVNDSNKVTVNDINKVTTNDSDAETEHRKLITVASAKELKPEVGELKPETILEIDPHRPDRIIFQEKEVKVTAKEFSLIHLLAQHPEQVMSYDELLDELWKDEEDAIYNRVSFHLSKVRRTILKIIGKNKINKEKVKNIFTVVSKRGIMLKLKADQIKIN
jgi:helicase